MKANFKRGLSIFLILCMTLTMMPGLAITGFANEYESYEEPYNYEFRPIFADKCQQMFPNGSTLTVQTELIAEYGDHCDEVTDFHLEVETDGSDLLTYEVNQDDNSVTFIANDEGKTGYVDVIFRAGANEEQCGEYCTEIQVSDTVVKWPETLSQINPECNDNPLVGEVVDLSGIQVEVSHYDLETGEITTETYTKDSENIVFDAAYDDAFEAADEEKGELHPFTRNTCAGANIYLHLYRYDEEENELFALGSADYYFEYLDYGIQWTDYLKAYDTQKKAEFILDTSLLADKGDCELAFALGYYDDEWEFVEFENQIGLYEASFGEDNATLTVYPTKLVEMAGDSELGVKVDVLVAGKVVNSMTNNIELYESIENYLVYFPYTMFVGEESYFDLEVTGYRENEEYPEGDEVTFEINDIKIIEGKDEVISMKKDEGGNFYYVALNEGIATIEYTCIGFDGRNITSTHNIEVVEEIYYADISCDSFENSLVPGGTLPLSCKVSCETKSEYIEKTDVDIKWMVEEGRYNDYVEFVTNPEDSREVVISLDSNSPVEDESIIVLAEAYEGDKFLVSAEYEIPVKNDFYCIVAKGVNPYLEVGDSCTVEPELRHIYVNDEGEYTNEIVPIDSWEIIEYYDDEINVVDNGDGSFEITRLTPWSVNFNIYCYDSDTDCEHSLYRDFFHMLDYDVSLDVEDNGGGNSLFEGEKLNIYLNDENLRDKELASVDWEVGYYCYDDETGEDYFVEITDGYIVSEDERSVEIDGTAICESNLEYIWVNAYIYSGYGDEKIFLGKVSEQLDVYKARDEVTELSMPENFVLSYAQDTNEVVLNWDDVKGAIGYEIYKYSQEDEGFIFYDIATDSSYVDCAVEAGNIYSYRIYAYNEDVQSNFSGGSIICRTLPVPTNVKTSNDALNGRLVVTWDAVEDADFYQVYVATSADGEYVYMSSVTGTSYMEWSSELGKTFYYKVRACFSFDQEQFGFSEFSELVCGKGTLPAPQNMKASNIATSGEPEITWDTVEGADSYEVYRAKSETGKYSPLGITTNNQYVDTDAIVGTTYYYKVKAICDANPDGNSEWSNYSYVTCDLPAPKYLIIELISTGHPRIQWNEVEGADKYDVYRSTSKDGEYKYLGYTTGTSYTNTGVTAGNTYYYKVRAIHPTNENANSAMSEAMSITCLKAMEVETKGYKGIYDGKSHKIDVYAPEGATVTYYDSELDEYTSTNLGRTAAGVYEIHYKVTKPGYVTVEGYETIEIQPKSIEDMKVIVEEDTVVYDGDSAYPLVYIEGVAGNDLEATYSNNTRPGIATATICGVGNYTGSVTVDYKIILMAPKHLEINNQDANGKPKIEWSAVDGADKYYVYRSTSKNGTYSYLGSTTNTHYTNTGAKAGTTYYYKVKAVWAENTDFNSNLSEAEGIMCRLSKPLNLKTSNDAVTGKPVISWDAVDGASKYDICVGTSKSDVINSFVDDSVTGTSFTHKDAVPGKTYYYIISSVCEDNYKGNSVGSSVISATCKLPAPTNVKVSTVASSGSPKVSWDKVADADKYYVYRSTSKNGSYTYLGYTTGTSYTNSNAVAGNTYYYRVKAIDADNEYANSATATSSAITCDLAQPTNVKVNNVASSGKPKITWNKVEDADRYYVYRATSKNGTYSYLGSTANTHYTNTGAKAGTTYYYKVKAVSDKTEYANSVQSSYCYITCDLPTPKNVKVNNVTSTGKPKITWTSVEGASKYYVYRSTSKNGTYSYLGSTANTHYTNTGAVAGNTYYYKVKAIHPTNENAYSMQSDYAYVTCDLAKPSIKVTLSNNKPKISWDAVSGAEKYEVYRKVGANGTYSKYYTTSYTSFTNSSATKGTKYYYKVVAVCAKSTYGNSVYSNEVAITSK